MRRQLLAIALVSIAAIGRATADEASPSLSFENRVRAQHEIERVYYAHRIGEKRPFQEAVPLAAIENRVRRYLLESAALEAVWHTRIESPALARELDRIVRDTHFSDRLGEIFHALQDDPLLIHECFVRPVLVGRLIRSFYEGDRAIHEAGPESWDTWWANASRGLDAYAVRPADGVAALSVPALTGQEICDPEPEWRNGVLDDTVYGAVTHTAVWTGTHMIVWGGVEQGYLSTGMAYDPLLDSWRRLADTGAPARRQNHVALWTGSEMIVWGGQNNTGFQNSGGRYDPAQDRWSSMATLDAPVGRTGMVAAWTGSEMIVWGGKQGACIGSGGRYDPASDTWVALPESGSPGARCGIAGAWTGTELIVWAGGTSPLGSLVQTGARYVRASDAWVPMTAVGAPSARWLHSAIWTGSSMVVWGGQTGSTYLNDGGRYDPTTDQWGPMTLTLAPAGRKEHTSVWSGGKMIIWGGWNGTTRFDSGGRYDPATDTWAPTAPGPSARRLHTAIWTGSRMIVWGGADLSTLATGGRYDPSSDTWTPTSTGPTQEVARGSHSAVWTGTEMIVWGGLWADETQPFAARFLRSGSRFDPLTATWVHTSELNAPLGRYDHTAVWTGTEMIVWGGVAQTNQAVRDGARYDPIQDTWAPMSVTSAPTARTAHTAVWTGSAMVVWGGVPATLSTCVSLNNGALYDPAADTWSALPLGEAPVAGVGHVAVWTGQEMLIWGGVDLVYDAQNDSCNVYYDSGRFDPAASTWSPIATNGAPPPAMNAAAAWTGDSMIVWSGVQTRGRYDPALDQWTLLPTANAPPPRSFASAVWTGSRFVVWGGQASGATATGGLYDPVEMQWSATPLEQAPIPRTTHTAVWDGTGMLVWGGTRTANGGRLVVPVEPNAPSEVDSLSMLPDRVTLVWSAPGPGGGSPTVYEVLRGTTNQLPVGTGDAEECWSTDSTGPFVVDATTPPSGASFYYLVRGKNSCGSGSFGVDSSGSERESSTCP